MVLSGFSDGINHGGSPHQYQDEDRLESYWGQTVDHRGAGGKQLVSEASSPPGACSVCFPVVCPRVPPSRRRREGLA